MSLQRTTVCDTLILIFGGSHTVSLKNKLIKQLCCISRIPLLLGHIYLKVAIEGLKFSWDWQNFEPCVVTSWTEVDLLTDFCSTTLSKATQSAVVANDCSANLCILTVGESPGCQCTIAQWGGFLHPPQTYGWWNGFSFFRSAFRLNKNKLNRVWSYIWQF